MLHNVLEITVLSVLNQVRNMKKQKDKAFPSSRVAFKYHCTSYLYDLLVQVVQYLSGLRMNN